jgi:hypothetical protein
MPKPKTVWGLMLSIADLRKWKLRNVEGISEFLKKFSKLTELPHIAADVNSLMFARRTRFSTNGSI